MPRATLGLKITGNGRDFNQISAFVVTLYGTALQGF
jgi:hypothetical protein